MCSGRRRAGVSWWRGDRAAETAPDRSLTEERLLRWACLTERRPRCCRSRAEASTVASFHVELGMSDDNHGRVDQAVCVGVGRLPGTRLASRISCRSSSHQTGRRPGSLSVSAGAPGFTATSARGMCLRVLDRRFDPGAPGILSAAPGANGHRIGRPESLFLGRAGSSRGRRVPIARKPIRGVLL